MAGFTAPWSCEHVLVDLMVLVAAMVLHPGEHRREWWGNTGRKAKADAEASADGRPATSVRPDRDVLPRRPGDVAAGEARGMSDPIRNPVPETVAARGVARRADEVLATTVRDTSTSPGWASPETRCPMCTAMPATSPPMISTSPVCMPLRYLQSQLS